MQKFKNPILYSFSPFINFDFVKMSSANATKTNYYKKCSANDNRNKITFIRDKRKKEKFKYQEDYVIENNNWKVARQI